MPEGREIVISLTGYRENFTELAELWKDYQTSAKAMKEDPSLVETLAAEAEEILDQIRAYYEPQIRRALFAGLPHGAVNIKSVNRGFGVFQGEPGEPTVVFRIEVDSQEAADIAKGRLAEVSQAFEQEGMLIREYNGRIADYEMPYQFEAIGDKASVDSEWAAAWLEARGTAGEVSLPKEFFYRDAGGVNRAATVVVDISEERFGSPAERAQTLQSIMDVAGDYSLGMTYNARTGTMEFVHTPEWGGLDPAQHLAYVFGLIEGLSQKFGELDVDFIRENITVADIIHKTPAKGVKVPENGLRDRTYGYEELTTRGLEAQEDYAQLGKLQRSLGPSAEPTAGRGASGSAVVPERPERKGPWAKRRTAAVKNGYSPLEFPGFDANAKRT